MGVDVERVSPTPLDPGLLQAALTPQELRAVRTADDPSAAFLHAWTVKEALVKIGSHSLDEVIATPLTELHAQVPGVRTTAWLDLGAQAVVGLALAPMQYESGAALLE